MSDNILTGLGNRIDEIFKTTEPSPERQEKIEALMNELVDEYGEESFIVKIVSERIMNLINMGE